MVKNCYQLLNFFLFQSSKRLWQFNFLISNTFYIYLLLIHIIHFIWVTEVTPQQQRVWSNGCGYCHPTPNSIMSQSPDSNCTKYIWITETDRVYTMPCGPGTKFDFVTCTCNHAYAVDCKCKSNFIPNK